MIVLGYPLAIAAIAANLWLTFSLYRQTSTREHVPSRIVSVDDFERTTHFGFRKYSLTVRIQNVDKEVEETSFTFPTAGASITLLKGPYGSLETDPFPGMWFVAAIACAFFGGMIWLLTLIRRRVLA